MKLVRSLLVSAAALGLFAPWHDGQVTGDWIQMPEVDWEQELGARLPLGNPVTDELGRERRLGEYFGERPVVLALVYYECPMLCNLVLDGLTSCLRDVSFGVGEDFDVLALSIDPDETTSMAERRRDFYVETYGRGSERGWNFVVAPQSTIEAVAGAVGFTYTYVKETDEYAHAAGVVLLTPEATVSRYFFGTDFSPRDMKLGLVDAGEGQVGSLVDKLLLRCFHYDPTKGKYGLAILSGIRMAGIGTVALMALFVIRMLLQERSARTPQPEGAS